MPFVLSCCSTADLTQEHFDRRDIHYICFHYLLNGKQSVSYTHLAPPGGNKCQPALCKGKDGRLNVV